MKAIFASILLMMFSLVGFAQDATITVNTNTCHGDKAPACPLQVCQNGSITAIAGITSGDVDSLKFRERYSDDGGLTWSTFTLISTSITTTLPSSGSAVNGRIYQYWLRVYQSGNQFWTFAEMYVNSAPTATLISDYTACCAGTLVTFNASAGGTNYDFKVNGVIAQTGASSSFATTTLANGDNVTVTINNGTCSATSAPIPMTVYVIPQATSVTGNTPMTPVCPGTTTPVTITGLTGTGPWHLEFWNTVGGVPTTLYFDAGTTTTPTTIVNVPVATTGQNALILRVSDAHCGF